MNILTTTHITKAYTDKVLLDDVEFSIQEGEKIGLIGINGTGKSTLLKIAAMIEQPDEGEVIRGNHIHICYLPQNPQFPEGATIYSYVCSENKAAASLPNLEGEAKIILNRLGFTEYDTPVSILSGGQRKRVALAAVLLTTCELLVLDEPTNHLDNEMVVWLEDYLARRRGALLMVTHDRYFLDRVSTRILEIDRGKVFSYSTGYSGFLALKAEREEIATATLRKRRSILREEIEWMQRGARARSTKQKAHIQRYENTKEETQTLKAHLSNVHDTQISSVYSRLGRTTIELHNIHKAYGDRCIINDFSYIFLRDDRVGFIGPNGCGKSTLMNIVTRMSEADSGSVTIGETVKIGYFSQENEYMDESLRVIDYIRETAEFIDTVDGKLSASVMCERFLFDSTLQYQKIEKLSGGEKRRLYLLKVIMEAPNVLVLDEPTNDLDISTLSILEDYLEHFAGIVITVSHDRYFLDRVVRRIFAFEGNGRITQYEGGYSDYAISENRPLVSGMEVKDKSSPAGDESRESDSVKTWKNREKKLKFTFKEQKEFETIEDEIAAMEERISQIEQETAQSATDFVKLTALSKEKDELEEALMEKMERWEYLTDLYEKISNGNK